jgi:hypothetical protein
MWVMFVVLVDHEKVVMLNEVKHTVLVLGASVAPLTSFRHLHPPQVRCILRENDIS